MAQIRISADERAEPFFARPGTCGWIGLPRYPYGYHPWVADESVTGCFIGWPSPAEEELADILSLDDYLIEHPDQTYLIKVTSGSMAGAGILPGDLLIVERGRTAKERDIIIAHTDGEWMMRYYEKRTQSGFVIGGVVTAVIRKYK